MPRTKIRYPDNVSVTLPPGFKKKIDELAEAQTGATRSEYLRTLLVGVIGDLHEDLVGPVREAADLYDGCGQFVEQEDSTLCEACSLLVHQHSPEAR